jgi:septal ring factor EnvC (AmiA/AmiB activator)
MDEKLAKLKDEINDTGSKIAYVRYNLQVLEALLKKQEERLAELEKIIREMEYVKEYEEI